MRRGTHPVVLDLHDLSYHRTFRKFGGITPIFVPDYSVDAGLTMPNQEADNLPFGCTGYTQTDNIVDEMKVPLKASFTYDRTCEMEGHLPNQGCQVRTSLDSTQVYGVQKEDETTDQQAAQHKGGQYFNVYDDGGMDWFDGIRVSVQAEAKGASCASPWFSSWEGTDSNGILPMPTQTELQMAANNSPVLAWHNYSCKGWKTINGVPYLLIKSWQGKTFGDNGWAYMSREVANTAFELRGSGIFMQAHARPEDLYTIKVALFAYLLVYLRRILGIVQLN